MSAFLVESALSFRPNTSWNNVSAVLLAPILKEKNSKLDKNWFYLEKCNWTNEIKCQLVIEALH